MNLQDKLTQLDQVPFEKWPTFGIRLNAVRANADGIVSGAITKSGEYIYRKWSNDFKTSKLVVEK